MTATLVIGSDESVLEGIAQALASAGLRCHVVRSIAEAAAVLGEVHPVVTLIERGCAADPLILRLRLHPNSALVLYRNDTDAAPPLPAAIQRMILADVVLPWERQRLITVIQRITERAVATGRARGHTPPEDRAV